MTLQKGIVAVIVLIFLTTRNFSATLLKNRATSGNLKRIWFGAKFKGILEQLVAEVTHRVPQFPRLQSTTNVKVWSPLHKSRWAEPCRGLSTWAGISLHKGSVFRCSWIRLPYFGVYILLFVLAVRLLRVQSILVAIVTNSHVIFFPMGSNEQARLLFSRAFRDSLFRGVYVMRNLQRWYCRFAFCWSSTQRENQ